MTKTFALPLEKFSTRDLTAFALMRADARPTEAAGAETEVTYPMESPLATPTIASARRRVFVADFFEHQASRCALVGT